MLCQAASFYCAADQDCKRMKCGRSANKTLDGGQNVCEYHFTLSQTYMVEYFDDNTLKTDENAHINNDYESIYRHAKEYFKSIVIGLTDMKNILVHNLNDVQNSIEQVDNLIAKTKNEIKDNKSKLKGLQKNKAKIEEVQASNAINAQKQQTFTDEKKQLVTEIENLNNSLQTQKLQKEDLEIKAVNCHLQINKLEAEELLALQDAQTALSQYETNELPEGVFRAADPFPDVPFPEGLVSA